MPKRIRRKFGEKNKKKHVEIQLHLIILCDMASFRLDSSPRSAIFELTLKAENVIQNWDLLPNLSRYFAAIKCLQNVDRKLTKRNYFENNVTRR